MSKRQRRKGHDWERAIVRSLRTLDPTAKRQLEYQEGLGRDITTALPLCIQAKCGARPPWLGAIQEAIAACTAGHIPIAAIRVDRQGEYAVLRWADWLEILKSAVSEALCDGTESWKRPPDETP